MTRDEVRRYLDDTKHVEGWFFPVDAYLFGFIDELQKRRGIRGNLFEIGVHHGKTAIVLARMSRDDEIVGVCDVFEQQELNRDRSGEGSREIFLRNIGGLANLKVFAQESSTLTSTETTTQCRFFHIDGGHLPENVLADLRTAERAVLNDGVVAVDDVFNPNWPGVSEGFYAYEGALTPFLIGGNKVFLSCTPQEIHPSDLRAYVDAPFEFAEKEWLGRRVLTAIRLAWVDLDPMGAARLHSR